MNRAQEDTRRDTAESAMLRLTSDLLKHCSSSRSPRAFVEGLILWLVDAFRFDQAIALFYDVTGKIVAYYTVGTPEGWLESYLSYYYEYLDLSDNYLESAPGVERILAPTPSNPCLRIDAIDWSLWEDSFFKRRYIEPAGLLSTLSFSLYDLSDRCRVAVCLDRKRRVRDAGERELLMEALPILNGMYRNYFYRDADDEPESPWEEYRLTPREAEIADMLCRGMRANRIGEALFISRATANKHIAHIYRKVDVTSQAELIVRAAEQRMYRRMD